MLRVRRIVSPPHQPVLSVTSPSAAALATGCRHHVKLDNPYDDLAQNSVLGLHTQEGGEPKSEDSHLFPGRTFASFFKEQYKGDTLPVDFSASTDFVRLRLPPRGVTALK